METMLQSASYLAPLAPLPDRHVPRRRRAMGFSGAQRNNDDMKNPAGEMAAGGPTLAGGFEPPTFGLGNRCSNSVSRDSARVTKQGNGDCAPECAQAPTDAALEAELRQLIVQWPALPRHIRLAVVALLRMQ